MRKPILKSIGVLIAVIGFIPASWLVLIFVGGILSFLFSGRQVPTLDGLKALGFSLACIGGCYSAAKTPSIQHDRDHMLTLILHYFVIALGFSLLVLYQYLFWTDPQWSFPPGFFAFPIAALYLSRLAFSYASKLPSQRPNP